MQTKELPEKAAKLLREIRKKYQVAFENLRVGNTALEILTIQNLEPLLAGKDPFKDASDFPFWVKLWEASMVLAGIMAASKPTPGQTLLELGAGLGAAGLAAAASGHAVTLSDYEPRILDFQRVNAAANGLRNVQFQIIDWLKPPTLPPFDTIIGAEILYRESFFEPLLAVFARLLKPSGVIYLAHDARLRSLGKFLQLAEPDYQIAALSRKLRSDKGELTVIVNRLTRREAEHPGIQSGKRRDARGGRGPDSHAGL